MKYLAAAQRGNIDHCSGEKSANKQVFVPLNIKSHLKREIL